MNPVIETILNRRSVRAYKPDPLPREVLETLVKAGTYAPTGSNAQTWRFVVVTEAPMRARLAELALPRYQKWLSSAPEAFRSLRREIDAASTDPVYYAAPAVVFVIGSGPTGDLDCAMACQNIMLAARSLGIGSCWSYFGQLVLDAPEVRSLLELREGEKVYGPLVLGYPQTGFPEAPPKRPPMVKWT
jgi:nitroreductase